MTAWRTLIIFLLILILGRFLVVGQAKVLFNTISSDGDESAYLALGLGLLEDGMLTDGARPPFYPFILSIVAERDWDYFTWAKMLTLGFGALAVIGTFLVGVSLFGWEAGLLAAFLLAANKEFHVRASTVYADVPLVIIFLGAWYFFIKSFQGWVYCILAGIFVGLAYLSKGSGPLLLGIWTLTAVLHYRGKIWRHKELLLVPLFFLITALPLLRYNVEHYGEPFFSLNTKHVLWMDRWDQSQVADTADMPTMTTYFQTHTPADIADRLQYGIFRFSTFLPYVLIPSRTVEPAWFLPVLLAGALIILGSVVVWQREWLVDAYRQHYLIINLSLLLFAVFFFFLSWYARLQVESRFVIPLLPPLYLLMAAAVVGLGYRVGVWAKSRENFAWWVYLGGMAVIILWGVVWLIQTTFNDRWSLTVDPFISDRQANVEADTMLDWFIRDQPAGDVQVIFGPAKSLPLWKFPRRFNVERIPIDIDTWPKFETFTAEMSAEYIIMDSDTARRRRKALSEYFGYEERVGVEIHRIPAGWALAYLHNDTPHTWAVFEPFAAPATSVSANFGNQIELLGYELAPIDSGPDRTLHLALYWRALTELPEDYTFFVHLTAPDGFVKAQRDQQPFKGLWPTTRWTQETVFADRFEIPLGEGVQSGKYLLLAGLYSPQSGERVTLVAGPIAPSPDAMLLGSVKIP